MTSTCPSCGGPFDATMGSVGWRLVPRCGSRWNNHADADLNAMVSEQLTHELDQHLIKAATDSAMAQEPVEGEAAFLAALHEFGLATRWQTVLEINGPVRRKQMKDADADLAVAYAELLRLYRERREVRDVCNVCLGTGTPVAGGDCICGGSGTHSGEFLGLHKALRDAQLQLRNAQSK